MRFLSTVRRDYNIVRCSLPNKQKWPSVRLLLDIVVEKEFANKAMVIQQFVLTYRNVKDGRNDCLWPHLG